MKRSAKLPVINSREAVSFTYLISQSCLALSSHSHLTLTASTLMSASTLTSWYVGK